MKQQSSKIPSVGDEAYVYDKNGNMVEDKYKKIQISYNYLNLPLQIEYKSGENNFIHFVYSATGEKLQKIVTVEGKVQSKTDYINGIEYKNDVLQRIAHTEGSLSRQDDDKFLQEYVLRDHLGNTRVTFTDTDNDGNINEKDIKQINNYYPFGLNMEGNWNGAAGSNKYQYNGKEWNDDFGLGWNHHDWRFLDPAIGRFVTIDRLPEEEEQEQLTPYQFAYNNPIRYDDPDGQCPTCLVGALIEGGIELGGQLLNNGGDFSKVDWVDVGVETAKGALKGTGVGLFVSLGADVVGEGIKASFDYTTSEGNQNVINGGKSGKAAAVDFVVGTVGGKLGDVGVDKLQKTVQKSANKAAEKALVKEQASKFATDHAKDLKKTAEPARAAGAARGAKFAQKEAQSAQTAKMLKSAAAKTVTNPARVLKEGAENRASDKIKKAAGA